MEIIHEIIHIQAAGSNYHVRLNQESNHHYSGGVFPVTLYGSNWEYNDIHKSETFHKEFNGATCKKLFEFSFCWRGVWEGRVYFPDDQEYWSEELTDIYQAWIQIESYLKGVIRKNALTEADSIDLFEY